MDMPVPFAARAFQVHDDRRENSLYGQRPDVFWRELGVERVGFLGERMLSFPYDIANGGFPWSPSEIIMFFLALESSRQVYSYDSIGVVQVASDDVRFFGWYGAAIVASWVAQFSPVVEVRGGVARGVMVGGVIGEL